MKSKLSNILTGQSRLRRLKATKNFPIGEPKKYRILSGSPSRECYVNGALVCASKDAVTGFSADGSGARECASCSLRDDGKCSYKCMLFLEHPEPDKQYSLAIPYSAQFALSDYVRSLLMDDLDAPDVITTITRIELPDGKSSYTFELDSVIEDAVGFTEIELAAVQDLLFTIRNRGDVMSVEEFADNLQYMSELEGISEVRAQLLAATVANKEGLIQ